MKYGAMNFPVKPVLEELNKISDLGFDYFELTLDPPCAHYQDIQRIKPKLVTALERSGMDVVCHLPTFVYTADLSPAIREASLKEILFSLETAADIGARKAILHPSCVSGLGPFVMKTARKLARQSLVRIMETAARLDITLCIENMFPRYQVYFEPDEFKPLFREFPQLRMTLDTGHASIGDPKGDRLFDFIRRHGDRISHVHVSDNFGQQDDHLAVGRGYINFQRFIRMLKDAGYDDTITLEIFSQDSDDLVQSRNIIAGLLADEYSGRS